jgi:hypothetical protein
MPRKLLVASDRQSGNHRKHRRPKAPRRMLVEQLELRHLLAGDGLVPAISVRLEAADPVTLQPIAEIHPGDEFAVVAYARDLRPNPQGVFSGYFDLVYPKNFVQVGGPIAHRGLFTNGVAGEVIELGTVDEVGGFSEKLKPPASAGEQLLAAIPMRATAIGVVVFETNAADLLGHDMLLYGDSSIIPTDAVKFGSLRLEVSNVATELPRLNVLDDDFIVATNSVNNALDVLANDFSPLPQLTIQSVDARDIAGEVAISLNKLDLIYTPRAGFSGVDVFRYSAINAEGQVDVGTVTLYVRPTGAPATHTSAVHLSLFDRNGKPITSLSEGDEFILSASVEDLRNDGFGVFAAYLDVAYASNLARVAGPIVMNGTLNNGIAGSTSTAGLVDEAGAFQSTLKPVGKGPQALFQVPMVAVHSGTAVFQAGPSDNLPEHQWLLFNDDQPVDATQIDFGEVDVVIHAKLTAVDDSFDLSATTTSHHLPVLLNDVSRSAAPLRITEVDLAHASGSVRIAEDGQSLIYERRTDFIGTEQFHYIVSDGSVSDVADVTIHVQPGAALNDSAAIRLEITDLSGAPKSTIDAGDEFQVRAYVKDLRSLLTGNPGVFAAYLDMLYEAISVSPVASDSNPRGIDLVFGADFQNDASGHGHVPGVIDEVGAFQTGLEPLGSDEYLLFTAKFQANAGRADADQFRVVEDSPLTLNVLANDSPNRGTIHFKSDPADRVPGHEFLMFDPAVPTAIDAIRYGSTSATVNGGDVLVTSVGLSRHGGAVSIVDGGRSVRYTPPADFSGIDQFTYSLGAGASAVVNVEVTHVNDAPQAHGDRYFASIDRVLRVDANNGVLANDQDPDRDTLRAKLVQSPAYGTLQLAEDGSFTFDPADGFTGRDSFTYHAIDGETASGEVTVEIEIAVSPVQVRLQATSESGETVTAITAGEKLLIHAYIQDLRDGSRSDRGVGAAYLDVNYDQAAVRPVADPQNRLGFDVTFGPEYQNARFGSIATLGKVDNVGALQTALTPIGRGEAEIFAIEFESLAVRAVNDEYQANKNSGAMTLDVLANDRNAVWQVAFQATDSQNSPQTDIVLYEPPQRMDASEVIFTGTSVEVRNPSNLTLVSVESSRHGGVVSIDSSQRVRYTPPSDFAGEDSFVYIVQDDQGRTSRGTAFVEVIDGWQNVVNRYDASGDSHVVPLDALLLINYLNANGSGKLPEGRSGSTFVDVSGDGFATPQDVLLVINQINQQGGGLAEGELVGGTGPTEPEPISDSHDAALGAYLIDYEDNRSSTSTRRTRARTGDATAQHDCDSFEQLLDALLV